jgi:hypothetical protein
MARRCWKPWLLLAVVLLLLAWGFDSLLTIHWVGSTDLEIEFDIRDVVTGMPVPGARIEVRSDEDFDDRDKLECMLNTESDGIARDLRHGTRCAGMRSGLGLTNTYSVRLPYWRFQLSAEGYEPGDWTELCAPQYRGKALRNGPGKAKLVVPASLRKRNSE